MTDAMIRHTT
ncbi:hypothetical protein D030_4516A, partial [Vibrio parahaemolyticus AQ3810]